MQKVAQDQASQKSQHGWEGPNEVTSLLLATDGFWGREIQVSSVMCALRGYPCSWRGSHSAAHIGSRKSTHWVLEKNIDCGSLHLLPLVTV